MTKLLRRADSSVSADECTDAMASIPREEGGWLQALCYPYLWAGYNNRVN